MYHDQGHIPVKLLGQGEGVAVTLGLPFLRMSPDHGAAFDIAGQGVARLGSMTAAIRAAAAAAGAAGETQAGGPSAAGPSAIGGGAGASGAGSGAGAGGEAEAGGSQP